MDVAIALALGLLLGFILCMARAERRKWAEFDRMKALDASCPEDSDGS